MVAKFPLLLGMEVQTSSCRSGANRSERGGRVSVPTWLFLGAVRVLRASAWCDEGGAHGGDPEGFVNGGSSEVI